MMSVAEKLDVEILDFIWNKKSAQSFYDWFPKDIPGNLEKRVELYKVLAYDPKFKEWYLEKCREYLPLMFLTLFWTLDPREEPGASNLPFIPRPKQEIVPRPRPQPKPKPRLPPTRRPGGIPPPSLPWWPVLPDAGGGIGAGWPRSMKRGRPIKKYLPSVTAVTLGIYGKKPTGVLSGLEFRPLPGKKPKKKKRRGELII